MTKFEISVMLGLFLGWVQLMCGFNAHAFYSLGVMIMITLLAIVAYLRNIYLDK